jgi:peptidoglycan hydrolase CwlO-like protein
MKYLLNKFKNLIIVGFVILLFYVIMKLLFDKNKEGFAQTSGDQPQSNPPEVVYTEDDLRKIKSETDKLISEKNTILKETTEIEEKTKQLNEETAQIRKRIAELEKLNF